EWSVIQSLTAHVDTGETLPRALYDKMLAAKNFQSGMQMLRQIEFSLFDMLIHQRDAGLPIADVLATLDEVRKEVAVVFPPSWHRFPHNFSHLFAGGYGAGYYSYKWAEVLSADAYGAFEEAAATTPDGTRDTLDPTTGQRFLREVLAVGGTRPAADSFRAFRGREPSLEALLRHSGMADTSPAHYAMKLNRLSVRRLFTSRCALGAAMSGVALCLPLLGPGLPNAHAQSIDPDSLPGKSGSEPSSGHSAGADSTVHPIRGFLPDLDFELVAAGDKTVTEEDFEGKVVLMFFGYASCPDICPTTMAQLSQVMEALGPQADQVRILFISVDPHRDTPEILQAYVNAFDKNAIGLTGSERQISRLARRYRVAYQIE